jgi:hypothetical protein
MVIKDSSSLSPTHIARGQLRKRRKAKLSLGKNCIAQNSRTTLTIVLFQFDL